MKQNKDKNLFTKSFISKAVANKKNFFSERYLSQKINQNKLYEKRKKFSYLINKRNASKENFSENISIKNKSKNINNRSFIDIAKRSRSDFIYLVRGKDHGKSAWHYVLIDKNKKEIFLAKSKTGSMDIANYGEILYSGWGENPPKEIVDKINKEFGL